MANKVYVSKEYERLVKRGFKPYSTGHQKMYTKAIDAIKATPGPHRIFEAGFGIGFGLTKMFQSGILDNGRYLGVEPWHTSFEYTKNELALPGALDIVLLEEPFSQEVADRVTVSAGSKFDEAFCIEVIEHVPMDQHLQFLIALRQMAPRLWFSTADMKLSKEGVRTQKEWVTMLKQAQFKDIRLDVSEWTHLYECR